ncbi:putative ABC transporter ATP-binding protein/permease [Cladobotryum mycophilum]|uniref:ABC transporter ATP-binding protein/permease n=1 Tax=Cladobotryum mycophilum TaxID=491253 RepID=A0ABR0SPT2_9HYPO
MFVRDVNNDTSREVGADQPIAPSNGLTRRDSLSFHDVESIEVRIRDLSVTVDTAPSWFEPATYRDFFSSKAITASYLKILLHGVTADLQPGSLTAIIGGSGSGKTTLLDTIAQRVNSSRLSYEGLTTFNGKVGVHNIRHAYVIQQDILLPTLTVRETLRYAAELRLPPSVPAAGRQKVVEEVIRELGLQDCADTRIGNSQNRGCSGGEKRRVSIGVQLLANPSVLFLDEPTTGLDAASALQVIRTLKNLALKGRVVITTIHQPRSEIWDLFDNLIVLTKGSPVYSGPISQALTWFEAQGFRLPPFVNPADFVIDTVAVDSRTPELEEESTARVNALHDAWLLESKNRFSRLPEASNIQLDQRMRHSEHAGLLHQLRVLTNRTMKVTYRDPMGMTASLMEAILMGIAAGYLFYNVGRDQAGIRSRQGCLYTAANLQGYLVLIFETYRMTLDIPTFDREFSEGCVSPIAFILSRRWARLPIEDVPGPLIFSILLYFMAGFERQADKFFLFFVITLLNHYIAISCATVCVVAIRHFAGASMMASLIFTLQSLVNGMIIQVNTLPVYVRWVKWVTYAFYAFSAYCGNEFQGNFYECPYPGGSSNPACIQYTGEFVMRSLGFPRNWVGRPIACMVAFLVFLVISAIVGLQYWKVEMAVSRPHTSDVDLFAGKEKAIARTSAKLRTVTVGLDHFALRLDKKSIPTKPALQKIILRPINAKFQAGVLNVIIGPSGSGKTSLLNAMALRLRNSISTKHHLSGKITFNDIIPSDEVIQSVCSYVHQDDDALLANLTVRETLRYAAALRLPQYMSSEEKCQRAEEIILRMGLKDCANNLIGNEMVKGISGGEKRRVSIAVQILTDPRVLLIDEPTSGLDAFTANSIVEVLQGLANEGRTVIMAIHQARSDLFDHFGNVLLLARGGYPAYFGPANDIIGYFHKNGHECPLHTNPADFALDLITVHPKQDGGEAVSRERVQKLIQIWSEQEDEDEKGEEKELKTTESEANTNSRSIADQPDESYSRIRSLLKPFKKKRITAPAELGALMRTRAPFRISFPLLLRRTIVNTRRQPQLVIARVMQATGVALIFTLFFAPIGHDYFSIQTRMGFFQQVGGFYVIGTLNNVAVYPNERDVFYREDEDGVYSADAFLATYTLVELPFEILNGLIFGFLAVVAIRLPRTVPTYFVASFACFSGLSCGESLGIMFHTLFSHTGFAVNLMGVFLALANSMAGILSIDMPALFRYFNYLSPIRYQARGIAYYSLHGLSFTCKDDQRLQNGSCPIETGDQVLDLYKFHDDPVMYIVGMAACTVAYRLLAWILVKLVRGKWRNKSLRRKERG